MALGGVGPLRFPLLFDEVGLKRRHFAQPSCPNFGTVTYGQPHVLLTLLTFDPIIFQQKICFQHNLKTTITRGHHHDNDQTPKKYDQGTACNVPQRDPTIRQSH